jgi:hypothetical protein
MSGLVRPHHIWVCYYGGKGLLAGSHFATFFKVCFDVATAEADATANPIVGKFPISAPLPNGSERDVEESRAIARGHISRFCFVISHSVCNRFLTPPLVFSPLRGFPPIPKRTMHNGSSNRNCYLLAFGDLFRLYQKSRKTGTENLLRNFGRRHKGFD